MKFTILALLVLTLLMGVANLAAHFGFLPAPSYQYKAFPPGEMNDIGFKMLAEENGIEIGDGKIKFPEEMRDQLLKHNIMPFTIAQIEKEGWKFVSVTSDDYYLFRKKK